jgi:hypothetical protein
MQERRFYVPSFKKKPHTTLFLSQTSDYACLNYLLPLLFQQTACSGLDPILECRMECLLIIQAGKRIPEEVLDPDELLQV